MLPLHLMIMDVATRRPTPVRLRVTGPAGECFAPLGRLAVFSASRGEAVGAHLRRHNENWTYIDGGCEIALPAGVALRVQATKGPAYTPLDTTVTLKPGQLTLRFEMSALEPTDTFSIDTRAHHLDRDTATLEAAAEGLDAVNIAATVQQFLGHDGNTYFAMPSIVAAAKDSADTLSSIRHGTLNVHPALGRVAMLNAHRIVHPIRFGDDSDDWSVVDWCRQCHRKRGLTVWVDAFRREKGLVGGEVLLAAILGEIDAIEVDTSPRKEPLLPWIYRLWNAGFRVPIVGASGKDSNATPLGAMRTVVSRAESVDWIESIRSGRTLATSGPILDLKCGDARPGATIANPQSALQIEAKASYLMPGEKLEVIADGQVIAAATERGSHAALAFEHAPKHSGWLAARVVSQSTLAQTSPISVTMTDAPFPHRRMFLPLLREAIEATGEWALNIGRYTDDKWKLQLLANCEAARARLDNLPRQ